MDRQAARSCSCSVTVRRWTSNSFPIDSPAMKRREIQRVSGRCPLETWSIRSIVDPKLPCETKQLVMGEAQGNFCETVEGAVLAADASNLFGFHRRLHVHPANLANGASQV